MGKKLKKTSESLRKATSVPGAEVVADVVDVLDMWRKAKNPSRKTAEKMASVAKRG